MGVRYGDAMSGTAHKSPRIHQVEVFIDSAFGEKGLEPLGWRIAFASRQIFDIAGCDGLVRVDIPGSLLSFYPESRHQMPGGQVPFPQAHNLNQPIPQERFPFDASQELFAIAGSHK